MKSVKSFGGATSIPDLVTVKASESSPPPAWALMQRELMRTMEEGAVMMEKRYADPAGVLYFADDVDDIYEARFNWCLFYAIGANERLLDMAVKGWNATTRCCDESVTHPYQPWLMPQIHNEYYCLTIPPGELTSWKGGRRWTSEWHHQGEGNMAFYDFGVACPTISENVRRARRFAAMLMGEDPEAPNYDARYKVFRSPFQTSRGPLLHGDLTHVKTWLHGGQPHLKTWAPKAMGVRASLYPVVKELEPNWYDDPRRAEEIVRLFEKTVLNCDTANNLAVTALITNAYLYTGEEKYRQWVLEYVEAWMERMRQNNGIVPDNVGPTGKIGENREGHWWGGFYGWNHYAGYRGILHSLTIAAECALLLSGDYGYLELLRSQIKVLVDNGMKREDGQLLMAVRAEPGGWGYLMWDPTTGTAQTMRMQELAHLYHASMSAEDYDLIVRLRDADTDRDWNEVAAEHDKNDGESERARFQYYDGKNPGWPEKTLRAEYQYALATLEGMRNDSRDVEELIRENVHPPTPVLTKGLMQVTMGAPQSVYNGGLLRAQVRYFDGDRVRPGLPEDVAALVEKLGPEEAGIRLVNLSRSETRKVIVQAGAFGEHEFTEVRYEEVDREGARKEMVAPVNAKHFAVELPPSTTIRVDAGMRRFVNRPSYAFPWHGDKVPVPFQ
jgi:hypothetical protein